MLFDLTLCIDMNDPVVGKANMDQHSFMSAGHVGTHLDTYLQTEIPTEFHHRRGVVVNGSTRDGADVDIDAVAGIDIQAGDFVIVHTGFLGVHGYGTREYFANHPQLSWTLIDYFLEKGVSFIGIDAAGVRRGDEHGVADRRSEDKGVYIIENLANVDKLAAATRGQPFQIYTGWTGLKGYSGLSCRVIAEL